MATPAQRGGRKAVYSQFYRDLALPLKLDLSSHSQTSTPSPLWRHGFGGPDPPPPPTLSLDSSSLDRLASPPTDHEFKTPARHSSTPSSSSSKLISFRSPTPPDAVEAGPSYNGTPPGSNPRSLVLFQGENELEIAQKPQRGDVSGALLALPPPTESVHVDSHVNGTPDGQGWVTVYGFTAQHTNLVLREFEKCGKILKHVPGPEGANWLHICFQNPYDVQKALQKNGLQINGALMVGVKLMDPHQRQVFTGKAKTAFMVLPPRSPGKVTVSSTASTKASRPYYLQQPNEGGHRFTGPIASPSKSALSRIVDLIFGI